MVEELSLILFGFVFVLFGLILIICNSKSITENMKNIVVGIIIISAGFAVVILSAAISYTSQVERKLENHINIQQEKEIEYSSVEIDSITGERIYRECTIDNPEYHE